MSAAAAAGLDDRHGGGPMRRLSTFLYLRPRLVLLLLLLPPLLWLGIIYLGSLFALLAQSFFSVDDFSGLVVYEPTLATYAELFTPANLAIITRTVAMAAVVTLIAGAIAFPLAYLMARFTGPRAKAVLYLAVMLPLWSSYLVRLYAWKLLLAREGAISWLANELHLVWLLEALLSLPAVGGPSLSFSAIGTFVVFVYMWLPFIILPIQAAIERIPGSYIEASGDLGASPALTLRKVILPLSLPGIAAGSIFTFSLTLGDYIIPQVIGDSTQYIGQVVYRQQGVAGNVPFAAAFSLVPIAVIGVYLWLAKRMGAFDAL